MEGNKTKMNKKRLLSSLIIVALLLLSTLAMIPMVTAVGPVAISVSPSAQNRRVGNTYTMSLMVNPNATEIDTLAMDYLYWDIGKMELVSVVIGDLFEQQTVVTGFANYTEMPNGVISAGQTKTWNYTLTTNLENCNPSKTYVRIGGGPTALKATLSINGQEVGNFSKTGGGQSAISNLNNWTNASAPLDKQYIEVKVHNWGTTSIYSIRLFMLDLNKRLMVWGSSTPTAAETPSTYATLTFKAIADGTCNFFIDASKVLAVRSGIPQSFTLSNGSVNIFDYYYPQTISGFTATTYNRTRIDLGWTSGYWADRVVVRGQIGSYPANPNAGTAVYNGTGSSYQHTGLYPGDHWYYRAWGYNATDHVFSETPAEADATVLSNTAPALSGEVPVNGAPSVDKTQSSVSVGISDANGDQMSWKIGTTHGETNSGAGAANGTISCNFVGTLPYATLITWYANVSDGFTYTNNSYSFTVRSQYQSDEPASFDATTYNRTQIDLSFTRGTGADKTYIEWNDHADWARSTGNYLYNGTGTTYNHQNLEDGTTYYYQAWGWNNTDAVYSALNLSDDDTTVNNYASTFSGATPADNTPNVDKTQATVNVTIGDKENDQMSWTIHGPYITTNSGTNGNGSISTTFNVPVLPYDTDIIWYVNMTDGFDWTNATYNFTVRAEYVPSGATGFTATPYNTTAVNLTWTKGASYAERTYVEWKSTATWVRGTGTEIYNGTGTTFNHTGRDPHTTYYYQVWSWNETDKVYSTLYESDDALTLNTVPTTPTSEHPHNNTAYMSVYSSKLNITATDSDGDQIKMEFYWGNGTAIAYVTVNSGAVAQILLPDFITPDWLAHDTTYSWYAKANDTYGGVKQSEIYNFHTSNAWDINEDGAVDPLDVSLLVTHYGETLTPGSQGWDINEDGDVGALDVSGLVTHYGE
jgi:hypothetical protein